jgi:hypothetical protein
VSHCHSRTRRASRVQKVRLDAGRVFWGHQTFLAESWARSGLVRQIGPLCRPGLRSQRIWGVQAFEVDLRVEHTAAGRASLRGGAAELEAVASILVAAVAADEDQAAIRV